MLCDSFFNSCFAFRASLDLPLRSMDSNFHPLFDRSWTQIAGYFHQKISEILERLLYHNSLPSIQPVCALLSFTSWLLPNLAHCRFQNYLRLSCLIGRPRTWPLARNSLASNRPSFWGFGMQQSWHETHSAHQCRQTAHRWNGAICHFTWKIYVVRRRSTLDTLKSNKKKNLTKPFHMDLLSGFGVTLIRRQADLPICGFTASFIRSDILKKHLRSSLSSLKRSH